MKPTNKASRRSSKSLAQQQRSSSGVSTSLFALEQRYLLDGAIAATTADVVDQQVGNEALSLQQSETRQQATEDAAAISELNQSWDSSSASTEIVFIDGSVANLVELLHDIKPNAEVHILDQDRDGVEQIADILTGRTDIDAIHILSHGEEGRVFLGNDALDLSSMRGEHADELAAIADALSEDGDILFYGCDLAGSTEGQQFMDSLAELTGADVAASIDDTGAARFGADWDLEATTGEIGAQALSITAFSGILADTDGDTIDDAVDLDDDNDGILDTLEGLEDSDVELATAIDATSGALLSNGQTVGLTISAENGADLRDPDPTADEHFIFSEGVAGTIRTAFDQPVTDLSLAFTNVIEQSRVGNFVIEFADGTTSVDPAITLESIFSLNPDGFSIISSGTTTDDLVITTGSVPGVQFLVESNMSNPTSPNQGGAILRFAGVDSATVASLGGITAISFDVDPVAAVTTGAAFQVSASALVIADTDGDGVINSLDLDSDNDGISDLQESGSADAIAADLNNDGRISTAEAATAMLTDTDNNGASDQLFGAPIDSDDDDITDHLDLDSDNDGIPDVVESQSTAGYIAPSVGADADQDGVLDSFDDVSGSQGGVFSEPVDTDGDGRPDYLDTNSDNDAVTDLQESGLTPGADNNGDGIADNLAPGSYADPDGVVNDPLLNLTNTDVDSAEADFRTSNAAAIVTDTNTDTDGDGVPDGIDLDDDNDGILDVEESTVFGNSTGGAGLFQNELFWIPLNGADSNLLDGLNSGDVVTVPTPDGGTVTLTFSNVMDLNGGSTGPQDFVPADIPTQNNTELATLYNASGAALFASFQDPDGSGPLPRPGADNDISFDVSIVYRNADGDIQLIPVVVADAEDTNSSTNEFINVSADGNPFTVLETSFQGGQATGSEVAGLGTNSISITDSVNRVSLFETMGTSNLSVSINSAGPVGGQGVAFALNFDGFGTDTDGDGVPNQVDLDSDNDGISDLEEAGHDVSVVDANNDGVIDSVANPAAAAAGDLDNDGLADSVEDAEDQNMGVTPRQSDGDGIADFLDLDSDGDRIADAIEARPTSQGNVITLGGAIGDSDNDGVLDHFDTTDGHGGSFVAPVDTDSAANLSNNPDGVPDYLDADSDGDGISDTVESGLDAFVDNNGDGIGDDPSFGINFSDADGSLVPSANLDNELGNTSEVAFRELINTPVIDLNDNNTSADLNFTVNPYTEGDGAVNVADSDADVGDSGDNIVSLQIVVAGVAGDAADETIVIDGASFVRDTDRTVSTTLGGVPVSIVFAAGTFSIAATDGVTVIPQTALDALIRGITYENASDNPTAGSRTLSFTALDANGTASTAAAVSTIVVAGGVNDGPTAVDDSFPVTEDTPLTNNVITNSDTDTDSDTLTVTAAQVDLDGDGSLDTLPIGTTTTITEPSGEPVGTIVLNADGAFTFTPATNYSGPVPPITYTIEDPAGLSDTAVLTLGPVAAVNDAPVANPDFAVTNEDVMVTGDLVTNDTDVDDDTLTVTTASVDTNGDGTVDVLTLGAASQITNSDGESVGSLTVNADGSFSFTPAANYNGSVPQVAYTITDGVLTDSSTLAITITPQNDGPDALDDAGMVIEDTTVDGNVIDENDTDLDGDPLTVTVASVDTDGDGSPEPLTLGTPTLIQDSLGDPIGTVTLHANGDYEFTPAPNYNGPVPVVSYTIADPAGLTDTANLTLGPVSPVNDAPVANVDGATTSEDIPVSGDVIANDTDADNTNAELIVVSAMVDIAGNGTADVLPLNTPTTLVVGGVTAGDITLNIDGTFTFAPAPDYDGAVPQVTYTIADPAGLTATSALDVNILSVDDGPVANDDAFAVVEDTPVTGNLITDPTTGDSDPEGDVLNVTAAQVDTDGDGSPDAIVLGTPTLITNGAGDPIGTLTVNADGAFAFDPAPNYNGAVPLVFYTIEDPFGGSDDATLTLGPVSPVNDRPFANPDAVLTAEDTPVSGDLIANDTDADDDPLMVTDATVDANGDGNAQALTIGAVTAITNSLGEPIGELTVNADGSFSFAPALNYNGPVPLVNYTVDDGSGTANSTASSALTIGITPENDPPEAIDDAVTVIEDTPSSGNVIANTAVDDTDPDSDPLMVIAAMVDSDGDGIAQPLVLGTPTALSTANGEPIGEITLSASGEFSFIPAPNFNGGVPVITYTVADPAGATDTANLTLGPVASVDDVPTVTDDSADTQVNQPVSGNALVNDIPGEPLDTLTVGDGNGNPLTTTATFTTEQGGTLVIDPDGSYTYTPPLDFVGSDAITFEVCSSGGCVPNILSLEVEGILGADINALLRNGDSSRFVGTGLPSNIASREVTRENTSGVVVNAVSELADLGALRGLAFGDSGISSVKDIQDLDGVVLQTVNDIEGLDGVDQAVLEESARGLLDFDAELRAGDSSIDHTQSEKPRARPFELEAFIREGQLLVRVYNHQFSESRVGDFTATLAGGKALPKWIDIGGEGLVLIDAPAGVESVRITITGSFEDGGGSVRRSIEINTQTGQIEELGTRQRNVSGFSDALEATLQANRSGKTELEGILNSAEVDDV